MRRVVVAALSAVLLASSLQRGAAQFYGNAGGLSELLPDVPGVVSEAPSLQYCKAGDVCCQHSASPADCASTASKAKGCRSFTACVPAQDPCLAATNKTSCLAAGHHCRFDDATDSCAVDAARHPCASISDEAECSQLEACRVQHTCQDACASCMDCLEAAREFAAVPGLLDSAGAQLQSEAAAFFRGFCVATAKGADPARRSEIMAGCNKIIADASRSPALLKRPGALCSRLGVCQASCRVPMAAAAATGAPASYANLSMCSETGLADKDADAPLSARDLERGSCLSRSDCAEGLECDTFTESTCYPTCDAETGMDKCVAAGTCVAVCERPDIKAAVEQSKRIHKICETSKSCAAGEVCQAPGFDCAMVTCNAANVNKGLDPIELLSCQNICWPSAPRMVNATFSNDGNAIEVLLNQEAAPINTLCMNIFDAATVELIGSLSTCSTSGNRLTIWLAGVVNIRPGSGTLRLSENNLLLAPAFGDESAGMFAGGLANDASVAACTDCGDTAVFVNLKGPTQIALPCSSTMDQTDFTLAPSTGDDAAASDDAVAALEDPLSSWVISWDYSNGFSYAALLPTDSLWMVDSIEWSLLEPADAPVLRSIVAATNNKTSVWDKQVLTIPVESLPGIPEGPFKLQVLVTNIFNVSSASQARAVKHNSTDAPLFELDKSANAFHPASGFVVEARPLPASCVFARTVWDWSTDIPNVSLEASSTGTSVALSAWDLVGNVEEGKPYTITLRASYEGSDVVAVDHVTLTAVGSPLSVSLAGPSGTVPMDGNLTFDASGSYDPDDPDNAGTQLSYLWTCINDIDRSPCFGSPAGDGLWMLDAKTLRPDSKYTVAVTAAKGSRNASSALSITPMAKPLPSGIIVRSCGIDVASGEPVSCPALHNPSDALSLVLMPDAAYASADVAWWYDPASVPGITLDDSNTATGTRFQALIIMPEALPAGGSVTVNANMTITGKDGELLTGVQSITVPLNSPPYCSASAVNGGCLVLSTPSASFPGDRIAISTAGWADADNDTLTYQFGLQTDLGPQLLAAGPSKSYSLSGLPPGQHSLYVCAVDSYGASACQTADVRVTPPPTVLSDEQVAEQIGAIDLAQLDGLQDVPSMVDAALQMAGLLAYSADQAASGLDGNADIVADHSEFDDSESDSEDSEGVNFLRERASAGNPITLVKASNTANMSIAEVPSVRNATTRLLKVMANAGGASGLSLAPGAAGGDPDKMNSLLAAGGKLGRSASPTPDGGNALLKLFMNTMSANSRSQRSITPQQTNSFADALLSGLKAAARLVDAAGSNQRTAGPRRSLLATALITTKAAAIEGPRDPLSPAQAYAVLADGAFKLGAAQRVSLGGGARVAGNAGICVGPALLPASSVDCFTVAFDCPGVGMPAKAILPQSFSASCEADASCSPANVLVWSSYFAPEGDAVPIIEAAIAQAPHLLPEDRAANATIISGVLNITANFSGPAGAFCASDTAGCTAELVLPLGPGFDPSATHACVQLTPGAPGLDASRSLSPANITQWRAATPPAPGSATTTTTSDKTGLMTVATCLADRQGLWAVVQAPAAGRPLAGDAANPALDSRVFSSEPVDVDASLAVAYTYRFDMDYGRLAASAPEMAEFRASLARAFLTGLATLWPEGGSLADASGALRLPHVSVERVRRGSVVADVVFSPPLGTSVGQMQALAGVPPAQLIASSSALRAALLDASLVTGGAGGNGESEAGASSAVLSGGAIAGIVVGGAVGLAALVAVVVVAARRRATAQVPITSSGTTGVPAHSYSAPAQPGTGSPGGVRTPLRTTAALS